MTPALELFYALIDLERYDEALTVYRDRLQLPLVYRLNEGRLRVDLVDALFPTSLEAMPRLTRKADQGRAVNARAQAYSLYGRPGAAVKIIEWFVKTPSGQDTFSGHEDYENNSVRLQTLAGASLLSGGLFRSYESACCALELSRQADDSFGEATALDFLGLVLAARGELDGAGAAWRRMERIFSRIVPGHDQAEAVVNSRLAKWRRLAGDLPGATQFAARAWDAAADAHAERDAVGIARLQGDIALALGSDTGLEAAEERLHYALAHARGADLAEEELPTLASLAELRRRQHNLKGSRELLEQVWKRAEEGPYPFAQADAYNLLALIEQEAGDHQASVAAATLALRRAWCDGPPFAYASGLETARRRLSDLGAQEPGDLRPFRAATLEVLPEIEIDTAD